METVIYEGIPNHAKEIRQKVFVDKQGFHNEFNDIDKTASHIVIFDKDKIPIATCRIFGDTVMNTHILGRLAVIKEYRGKKYRFCYGQRSRKVYSKKWWKMYSFTRSM